MAIGGVIADHVVCLPSTSFYEQYMYTRNMLAAGIPTDRLLIEFHALS